ncbi:MAG: hypothetical protein ACR2F1_03740 [Nitrososphaeraceae archaeon]
MFLLILIPIAYRLQEFFQGYCISNTSISLKVPTGVERRRWDSNLEAVVRGLCYLILFKKIDDLSVLTICEIKIMKYSFD